MPQYSVLPANLSCYKGYVPPSLSTTIAYVECFPKDMCMELCQRVDMGKVYDSQVHDPSKGQKVEHYHRSSQGITLDMPTYKWMEQRITEVAKYHIASRVTERYRQIKLAEALQFLRYDEKHLGKFRRHWDDAYHDAKGVFHMTAPQRKFTTITLLNRPEDYEGGELVLDTVVDENREPLVIKPLAGSMIIFPSDQRFPHEVKPVTKGTRRSVVAWFDLIR